MKVVITIELDEQDLMEKKTEEVIDKETKPNVSDYARFFDECCPAWQNDSEYNLMYLHTQQQYATEKLKVQGYLFLNDVYDMLGFPRTKAGQIIGWIYDEKNPIGDNFVDFDIYAEHNIEFVNGYKRTCLLDFNVDGNILERI